MAFSWKENYATIINANTWDESVEGYKITNVFGLAWNYYVIYTKFITGLDLTLDMGMKIETFTANCYKLGYASEYKSNTYKSADMAKSMFKVFESEALVAEASEKKVAAETALIGKITRTVGTEVAAINAQEVAGGTSAEVWTSLKTIETPDFTLTCAVGAAIDSGSSSVTVLPSGVVVIGTLIDLG